MPASQTIEGGVQVRVTRSGLTTIANALRDIINTQFANGLGIPGGNYDIPDPAPQVEFCYRDLGNDCRNVDSTCPVSLNVTNFAVSTIYPSTVRIDTTFNASSTVPVHVYSTSPWCSNWQHCTFHVSATNAHVNADVNLGINSSTGNLTWSLGAINALNLGLYVWGDGGFLCELEADAVNFIADILSSEIGTAIVNLLRPLLNNFLQGIIPNPLGLEGLVDVGSLLSSIAPGVKAKLEMKGVAGGYVSVPAQGLSMGMNMGLNADRDVNTRSAGLESQPALCVPQWPTPDLANVPPAILSRTSRGTFALNPAAEFLGVPDPAADVAIGMSRTFLNQAGRHVIASGAMCLGVGSQTIPQLNLGTVGLLVQSLAELGTGKEPVLMELRPTDPITFDIGTGTSTSPHLTLHLKNLEIDFYALIYERYIRAFTLGVTTDVGVNLQFSINAAGKPVITPMLVGLSSTNIKVKVTNSEFLRESAAQLEAVFPTLLNLLLPALTSGIPPFPVPAVAGFTLGNLKLTKVVTTQDQFLAVYASLAQAKAKTAGVYGKMAFPGDEEEGLQPVRTTTRARVVRVDTPAPEKMRLAMYGEAGGELPLVELDLGGDSPTGAPLEWQWRLDGGMWREFSTDAHPILSDLAFAVQGRHTITVRSRAVGDYESTELEGVDLPVVIDSAGPRILYTQVTRAGEELIIPAIDLVTADADVLYAFGRIGADQPATAWAKTQGHISAADAKSLADAEGRLHVFAKDELGNTSVAIVEVGSVLGIAPTANTGCGCAVGGEPSGRPAGGVAVVAALLGLAFLGRRRLAALVRLRAVRRALPFVVLFAAASANPGCSCGDHPVGALECATDADCATSCPSGQVGYCGDNGMCVCKDDIPIGIYGLYSDVAVTTTGLAYISAYNQTHGDLMVGALGTSGRVPDSAWSFIDGVPAGPVAIPQSTVRGGVRAAGDDVGLYTSIAMAPGDEPIVSYYDRTHASLKVAAHYGGQWNKYTVDAGVVVTSGTGGKDIGKYSSVTVDRTGRPGIAYLALLSDGGNGHAEVRFAQAKIANPGPSDWMSYTVENLAIPTPPPAETMLDDIPWTDGLFVNSARKADDSPVIVWYDRPNHCLKLSEWDPSASRFKASVILDGWQSGVDVGWYPSLAVTSDGKSHVSYVDAQRTNLLYIDYPGGSPVIVDDGYRIDGVTASGLPRPVFHFVGDNSGLVQAGGMQAIVYQDATSHELLLATKGASGWTHTSIAGYETPFVGAYGFFASGALTGDSVVMSTYVINQSISDYWVEVFRQKLLTP